MSEVEPSAEVVWNPGLSEEEIEQLERDLEELYGTLRRQRTVNVGGSKLMWLVGDGQLFEHDDREAAEEWAEFSESEGPTLVHVTPVEASDD